LLLRLQPFLFYWPSAWFVHSSLRFKRSGVCYSVSILASVFPEMKAVSVKTGAVFFVSICSSAFSCLRALLRMASSCFSAIERTLASLVVDNRRHHCLSQSYPTKFPISASAMRFFLIFIIRTGTKKMLFMVVPLLGVDFKPAAGLDYYFAFFKPSRGRFEFFAYFPKLVSMQ